MSASPAVTMIFFRGLCVPRSQPRKAQETRFDTLVVQESLDGEHLRENICKVVKRLESVKEGEGRLWESERKELTRHVSSDAEGLEPHGEHLVPRSNGDVFVLFGQRGKQVGVDVEAEVDL